jgi:hypothetical protein
VKLSRDVAKRYSLRVMKLLQHDQKYIDMEHKLELTYQVEEFRRLLEQVIELDASKDMPARHASIYTHDLRSDQKTELDASTSQECGAPGAEARVMDAEAQVAQALLALVHDAPGGQIPGPQLCSKLYRQRPDAKKILHAHQGLKGFIEGSELKGRVCFVADQVCEYACKAHKLPSRSAVAVQNSLWWRQEVSK